MPQPAPRSYFIRTFGCQMNEHDSERLAGVLEADGLVAAEGVEDADVVVLNTCCIRENADNKLYGTLGHLKSVKDRRPGMQIAVGGCLAQKDRDLVARKAPWVDAVWGTHNISRAADLLRESESTFGPVTEIIEADEGDDPAFASALPTRRDQAWAAWVTIQVGCDNNCAFCIVPSVRGPEASRPFGSVVAEVEQLAAAGTLEVTLLGQNVNSYGRDLTTRMRTAPDWRDAAALVGAEWTAAERPRARPLFADLLRAVARVEGIGRVRYTSPHPKDLRPETIAAMAEEPAVCEHLHLPLQSGSDRILAAMHRGYSSARYLEKLAAARAGIPDLAVSTDIIVGFPGETDDDFDATLAVAAEAAYDSAYTFIYSPRTGTEAAAMTAAFVDPAVVAARFEALRVVVERSALASNMAREGRVDEVLVEGPSKRDPNVLSGRTRQNKLVHFTGPAPTGALAMVEITRGAPHFLEGRLLEVTAPPRHRTRIPVAVL
ncbi:tRNA (N6-isopentenyl adenosine(37)-C2)-methylthiotransferase MiaB [Acidiferrimicrobium sp. IK]|uniref:tRNA (N6-isopentenyl adenosine(37)-C2)-methylthiotransferase MiaB n=1 Tax=Acidiferrimicrobium sp. IK TaxID=2871700 RepID=UPI0021CB4CAF|nr:tRNA (N6-isopentenyl adenosine(37)-C2)-methylthiotransferase MiaB [Acidiferrimicrobium sp. IK]MCU4183719.1 tRNA (N6-isopentenyl adenosine(37)-C2)-methylthiotransferase MiaB [Acidiferrimicrobium sp. IK]